MFEVGKTYWFTLKGHKVDCVNVKGKVMDENDYMVKVDRNGVVDIIPQSRILNVNEAKDNKEERGVSYESV